jgi:hypothetical protein
MEPVIYVSVLRFGVDVHRYFDVAEMTYRHYRLRESIRTLLTANALGLNMRLLVRSRMQLGAVHTGVVKRQRGRCCRYERSGRQEPFP